MAKKHLKGPKLYYNIVSMAFRSISFVSCSCTLCHFSLTVARRKQMRLFRQRKKVFLLRRHRLETESLGRRAHIDFEPKQDHCRNISYGDACVMMGHMW